MTHPNLKALALAAVEAETLKKQLRRAEELLAQSACRCDEGQQRCADYHSERGCKSWAARMFLRHPYPYPFESSSQMERYKLHKTQ